MKVRVLLFASYADALGADSIDIEAAEGANAGEVLSLVQAQTRAAIPPHPMMAVNATYADLATVIRPGDEVAIIPPVAGG